MTRTRQASPLLLILDDLQWADDLTLGFLRFLLDTRALDRMALLVIGTYRLEEVHGDLREIFRSPQARRLELSRLDGQALGSLVSDMLALSTPPQIFVEFLAGRSGGNPFFVAEYLRAAVAEGLLFRDAAGHWQVAQPGEGEATRLLYEALPLPDSVHELVGRRLAGLSPPARRVAEVAAVLGREADESLLSAAAGLDGSEALEALEELRSRQVLEEIAATQHTAPRLRFLHDQIWEIAYERIEAHRRHDLHRAAAETLEARLGADRDEHLGVLGHHWQQAGDADRARTCYRAGARRARARYAHGEAERLYRAYLALVEAPTPESVEAQNELALELAFEGRPLEAVQAHETALETARGLGDSTAVVQTLQWLGDLHTTIGKMNEAGALYSEALALAREIGDLRGEGASIAMMANLAYQQGYPEPARRGLEEALAIARALGNRRDEGRCVNRLASVEMHHGRPEQARALFEQALLIHQELGDRKNAGVNLANLGVLHNHLGLQEPARAYFERALAIFREIGYRRFEAHALVNLADFHASEGRLQQALTFFEQSLLILREIGDRQWLGISLAALASWLRRIGRIDEAQRRLQQAEAILRELDDQIQVASCLCERASIALAQGLLAEARQILGQVMDLTASIRAGAQGPIGKSAAVLRKTVEAAEAGLPLFRGERLEDLPDGLRRWLRENGEL